MNKKYIFVSVLILNQSIYLFTFSFTLIKFFFAFLIIFLKNFKTFCGKLTWGICEH